MFDVDTLASLPPELFDEFEVFPTDDMKFFFSSSRSLVDLANLPPGTGPVDEVRFDWSSSSELSTDLLKWPSRFMNFSKIENASFDYSCTELDEPRALGSFEFVPSGLSSSSDEEA